MFYTRFRLTPLFCVSKKSAEKTALASRNAHCFEATFLKNTKKILSQNPVTARETLLYVLVHSAKTPI